MKRATVAIIGRMNVGKSTLFNRLTETNKAITSSWAGTTRDTNRAAVIWRGMQFDIVDTGGLDVEDDEQLEERVIRAAYRAAEEADMVLFVVDGRTGVLPQEKEIAKRLREIKTPHALVINKIDSAKLETDVPGEVYQLNIEPSFLVSSKNGSGTGDLLDHVVDTLDVTDAQVESPHTKVAIVGRPNVGKSSLVNAILGEERLIVADAAHTTRDTNDIHYRYNDHDFLLIDTAGLRRRTKVGEKWSDKRLGDIEKKSTQGSIEAIERADVVILVLESQRSITAQDKKIAQFIESRGKALVLAINKWDLIPEKETNTINEFIEYFDAALPHLKWAPMVFVSAMKRLRVHELLNMVDRVSENYARRISDEDLKEILKVAKRNYQPKESSIRMYKGRKAVIQEFYQTSTQPPEFYLQAKRYKEVPQAIIHIIERELRERFDYEGVLIRIQLGD